MKNLTILFALTFSSLCYAGRLGSIRIPPEVIRAMNLSPELQARLSGGDIVGNGGGLIEQEFRYAYRRITTIIKDCQSSVTCPILGEDLNTLSKISSISSQYEDFKDRLIFLSEDKYPGFFQDSTDSKIRIAKTAFISGAPVFINLDMVYEDGEPSIDFGMMISILVHEIGHQAGIRSHSYLDDIGAKLRDFLSQDFHINNFYLDGRTASLTVYNLMKVDNFSEVFFRYDGAIVPLTPSIKNAIQCRRTGSIPIGYEVSNPHWERIRTENRNTILGYNAWLKVKCLELGTSAIWTEDNDLNFNFRFKTGTYLDYSIKLLAK